MKKLALVSFLAQMSHPMFAHDRTLPAHVTERTMVATRTGSVQVKLAQSCLVLCEMKQLFMSTDRDKSFTTTHCPSLGRAKGAYPLAAPADLRSQTHIRPR